jgi:hypothetical protein
MVIVKFTLEQAMKSQRGSKGYSSTLSLTLALGGGGSPDMSSNYICSFIQILVFDQ